MFSKSSKPATLQQTPDVYPYKRRTLQKISGLSILSLFPALSSLTVAVAKTTSWNQPAFNAKGVEQSVKSLGGNNPQTTQDVTWGNTPEIAENGMVVPISVASKIPNTESIAILIDKNPNTLSAVFNIPAGTDPSVITRVKMSETSLVYALIKANGQHYLASREIKVTLGGCGG